ncbi:unnamed protein product, partial [Ectocarpus sp. 12 AP-2014]
DDLRRSPVAPLPARRARRYAGARRSPSRRGVMVRGAGGDGGARQLLRGAEGVPTGVSKVLLTCVAADGRGRRRELVVVDARWPGERRRQVTVSRNLRVFFSSAEGRALVRRRAGVHGGEQAEDGVEVTRGVDLGGQLAPLVRGKLPKLSGAAEGVVV